MLEEHLNYLTQYIKGYYVCICNIIIISINFVVVLNEVFWTNLQTCNYKPFNQLYLEMFSIVRFKFWVRIEVPFLDKCFSSLNIHFNGFPL